MRASWRARLREAAQNLGLLVLSTILAAGGAEWVLRRYRPEVGLVYRLVPRYHYSLAPGARKLFRHGAANGGGLVLSTVNSEGFRGDELRTDGAPRVVVYGDSFIEAEFATLPETFAKRLEARLGAALGRSVEVVNAGVNGYGPDQALRRFEDEARWLRPALVVFSIFADNDFGDVLRNRLYRLDDEGRLVEGGGVVGIFLRRDFEDAAKRTPFHLLRGLRRLLRGRRRAAEVREQQLPQKLARYIPRSIELCRQEYEAVVVRRQSEVTTLLVDHYDADVSLQPESPAAAYKLRLFEALLGRIRAATAAAGIPALVLVIPSPIDVCPGYDVRVDPAAFPEYEPSRLSGEAASAARRQGLPVVDLFGPFRKAGADGLYYRHGNDHWNAQGQDLAARLVAERVLAEGWLRPER
jgi:SGNH hydrolase-like domain, acetyltransferase AlgX